MRKEPHLFSHQTGKNGSFQRIDQLTPPPAQQALVFLVLRVSIDCEQSLFFFRFSEGSAIARESRTAKPRERREKRGRQPKKKTDRLSFCASPRLAPSVTRGVICVSRKFCSTNEEKRETASSLRRARSWRERSKKTAPSYFACTCVSRTASLFMLPSWEIAPVL